MGRAIGSISDLDETKTLQEHMVQEAKAHGADAILIENMDKRITGEYVDWGGAGTYYGPGGRRYPYGIAGGTSVRDYRQDIEITAVFLKYKTE